MQTLLRAAGAFLLLGLVTLPAAAAEVISARAGVSKEPGAYEMEAVAIINARPAALRFVISNLCNYRDDMSHVSYCRVFKVDGNKAWSYAVIDAPVIDPRDYVIVSEVTQDLQPDGTGIYHSRWQLSEEGPAARKGIIRLTSNEGSWTLKSMDGGKRTQVVYRIKCSPGGNIPGRAVGYVQKVTLPQYVGMLERLANNEDRRRQVVAPHPGQPWVGVAVLPLDNPLPQPGPDRPPLLLPIP